MSESAHSRFQSLTRDFVGYELTHMWQGHGSAIFAEFGKLTEKFKRDGSPANAEGEISLMIEWSWRIEHQDRILFGAWNDEMDWESEFRSQLLDRKVVACNVFGTIPEICIELDGGYRLLSFAIVCGDPRWTLFDRRKTKLYIYGAENGIIVGE